MRGTEETVRNWTLLALLAGFVACDGDTSTDDTIIPPDTGDDPTDTTTDTEPTDTTDTGGTTTTEPAGSCGPLPTQAGTNVAATDSLFAAIANAAANDVLILAPGTYELVSPVNVSRPITIRSQTNNPADVVIDGSGVAGDLFRVSVSNVTFAHVTIEGSDQDSIAIKPESNVNINGFRFHDVIIRNSGAYGIRIDGDFGDDWLGADDGEISCSRFVLEDGAKDDLAAICVAGAIDARGVRNWLVRDNRMENFWCEDNFTFPPALRFWRGSRNVEITRNRLIDTPLGIVAGQTQEFEGRTYTGLACPSGAGVLQLVDSRITNNIVSSNDAPAMRAGIMAENSCNTRIIHNSVYSRLEETARYDTSAIEHTYTSTSGVLANNLTSHTTRRLANSALVAEGNVENVPETYWFFPGQDDFRTSPTAEDAIDQGSTAFLADVPVDVDGEPRDDGMPDVGADER